jgi:3-methyl-2-oxobutanoate hydroxymethyltransferase
MTTISAVEPTRKKVTVRMLRAKKEKQQPITMLTSYNYPFALAAERAGVDVILVGDSLAMVELGHEYTLSATMDDMIHHCKAVSRGAKTPLLVGDMPFMSFQVSVAEAVRNAGRFLQEAGMDAVKLEGGAERRDVIRAIAQCGIPVMGHLGLTPQSIHAFGGYRSQGKTATAAARLIQDAHVLENEGCFAIVLESIPNRVASLITSRLEIPTIGIGSGGGCDGQVLVAHDVLGMFDRFTPRFAKRYAELGAEIERAFAAYIADVSDKKFPEASHATAIDDEEYRLLLEKIG